MVEVFSSGADNSSSFDLSIWSSSHSSLESTQLGDVDSLSILGSFSVSLGSKGIGRVSLVNKY